MSRATRLTLAATAVLAVAGVLSGLLIDERHGAAAAVEVVLRTVVIAAAALAAGGAFVVLASLRRRVRPRPLGWAATVVAWAAFAWLIAVPVGYAVYLTHLPSRRTVRDADLGRPKEPVALRAADGVTLRGWYVPSRNRAAVIVLHGTGSNRDGVARHARLLARHGYGVLALDLRGHGRSGGRSTSLPWKLDDLDAAIAWLSARPDIDRGRLSALGVSLGGEVALRAAARRPALRALVAEGVAGGDLSDARRGGDGVLALAQIGVLYAASDVLAGGGPGASDAQLVRRVAPRPVLLISAGAREGRIARSFAAGAGPAVSGWNLPHAAHGSALRTAPREYERRVVSFLDRSLLGAGDGARAGALRRERAPSR